MRGRGRVGQMLTECAGMASPTYAERSCCGADRAVCIRKSCKGSATDLVRAHFDKRANARPKMSLPCTVMSAVLKHDTHLCYQLAGRCSDHLFNDAQPTWRGRPRPPRGCLSNGQAAEPVCTRKLFRWHSDGTRGVCKGQCTRTRESPPTPTHDAPC